MEHILDILVDRCTPAEGKAIVQDLIKNEEFHYIELTHKSEFVDKMWDIGQAIHQNRYLEMDYKRTKDGAIVKRRVKPVAIMFSEYYFYLTAFIEDEDVKADFDVIDDAFPTIYRIDRIAGYKVLDKQFKIPYGNRFKEGEFRKESSSCMVESFKRSNSGIRVQAWKQFLTDCQLRRFWKKKMAYTRYLQRCSARALICG